MTLLGGMSGRGRVALLTACAIGSAVVVIAITRPALVGRLFRRRRRQGKSGNRLPPGASLADEIKEALQRDSGDAEADAETAAAFRQAAAWVSSEAGDGLSDEAKLALYGCYKQALAGNCSGERPWGMEARYKWEAWHSKQGATPVEAMLGYIDVLDTAAPGWRHGAEAASRSGGISMAPCVSTMGRMQGDGAAAEVDDTPIGQLCERIAEGDDEAVQEILKRKPALAFAADVDGMTPLHWAADRGAEAILEMLLSRLPSDDAAAAARLNARDKNGDTCLHFAVLADNVAVAKSVLERGADPKIENNDGETPFSLAESDEWRAVFAAHA